MPLPRLSIVEDFNRRLDDTSPDHDALVHRKNILFYTIFQATEQTFPSALSEESFASAVILAFHAALPLTRTAVAAYLRNLPAERTVRPYLIRLCSYAIRAREILDEELCLPPDEEVADRGQAVAHEDLLDAVVQEIVQGAGVP